MLETEEIKKLYRKYASQNIEMPKEYYKISRIVESLKAEIHNSLDNTELKENFVELCERMKEISMIDCEQCFINGYSLGTRLTAESFVKSKENTNN